MEKLESFNPRTGGLVGSVVMTEPEEVPGVVERSRAAFELWSAAGHEERRRHLKAFKKVLLDNMDRVAEMLHEETGKDHADAYVGDISPTIALVDYYARKAEKLLRPRRAATRPMVMTRAWTEYHPRGVVAVIPSYNFPLILTMVSVVPALAAGCSVVLKPSELAPLTGQLIEDLFLESGMPADLVQVIQGGAATGAALVGADVDLVVFTGSPETGRKIAAGAAKNLTPTVLELGGKDAMIVLDDADPVQTARAAVWGSTLNAGQVCISVERVYVMEGVAQPFLEEMERAIDEITAGTGDARDIGAIIDPQQIEIINSHVDDALSKGATLRRGGHEVKSTTGSFFEPTLLTGVDHSMKVMRDETFGPVVAVMQVPDEETAISLANDSRYGLHGSVWSGDKRRAAAVASRMHTGTVAINDHMINLYVPDLAFGGVKDSGYGVEGGPEGIRSFCYTQSFTSPRWMSTSRLLLGGRWNPRRFGPHYWKNFIRLLYRW